MKYPTELALTPPNLGLLRPIQRRHSAWALGLALLLAACGPSSQTPNAATAPLRTKSSNSSSGTVDSTDTNRPADDAPQEPRDAEPQNDQAPADPKTPDPETQPDDRTLKTQPIPKRLTTTSRIKPKTGTTTQSRRRRTRATPTTRPKSRPKIRPKISLATKPTRPTILACRNPCETPQISNASRFGTAKISKDENGNLAKSPQTSPRMRPARATPRFGIRMKNNKWAEVGLDFDDINIKNAKYFGFFIKIDPKSEKTAPATAKITLRTQSGFSQPKSDKHKRGVLQSTYDKCFKSQEWHEVLIPVRDIEANPKESKGMLWGNYTGNPGADFTVYIDDVAFYF